MKSFYLGLILCIFSSPLYAQLNVTYQGNVSYDNGVNDVWGYVAPDNSEYAIVGVFNGVSIVDVTDPENPAELFFVPGVNSGWRDIKTWGPHAYVTNETGNGLMVIDMSNLPNSIDTYDWTPQIENFGQLEACHNIWIDEFGYAYLVGCSIWGGMLYIDVFSDPGNPIYVDHGPSDYSHDVYVRNNLAYASEIYNGTFTIYDVSNKSNTVLLGDQETASSFTHNTWLSDDGNILFTTDEVSDATVGSYDVSDPTDIIELDQFLPLETLGTGVIPHNVHVFNDWLIISYYSDGCIIVDGSNPNNLVEVGNFDTYIPQNTGFSGAWGAYPFLPSGVILVSDMSSGLYVLAPNYVNACWLEGNITDSNSQDPLFEAEIDIQATNVIDYSELSGDYFTGYAVAGTYDVTFSKAGYVEQTISVDLANGETSIVDVELVPISPISISGQVTDLDSGDPVPNAFVKIFNQEFDYELNADAQGQFSIGTFFSGNYEIIAGQWGWLTKCSNMTLDENNTTADIPLSEGIYDDFTFDLNWNSSVNGASSGDWEIGEPDGTNFQGAASNPDSDVNDDCFENAYVTGNGGGQAGNDDVDDGSVILTSPEFSTENNPVLSYYRWWVDYDPDGANDEFQISVSDGITQVTLETLDSNSDMASWEFATFNLNDLLPTSEAFYTVSFETSDDVDNGSIVEAALDLFQVMYDPIISTEDLSDYSIQVYPNPSKGIFTLSAEQAQGSTLTVYSPLGKTLEILPVNSEMFTLDLTEFSNGIYFYSIEKNDKLLHTGRLIKN